ncbi:hypothetical protein [Enterococcus wangshanyuanii]|uniref:Uncharacterized protein n=1 Tax=Enterococcus wangshanyuanii TaxID=2005703 RepID=A0ABQ1NZF1_9ENTE|nr:hypothetical protein [Enterococcus wangshanyuanii]GGC87906.1 hypothetical protein GCM10011573_16950 [Enterococcus wangshanyuanii]
MIAKVELKWNRKQYTKKDIDCEVIDQDRFFTYFRRPKQFLESPKQRNDTDFRVANDMLPLYFYAEEN